MLLTLRQILTSFRCPKVGTLGVYKGQAFSDRLERRLCCIVLRSIAKCLTLVRRVRRDLGSHQSTGISRTTEPRVQVSDANASPRTLKSLLCDCSRRSPNLPYETIPVQRGIRRCPIQRLVMPNCFKLKREPRPQYYMCAVYKQLPSSNERRRYGALVQRQRSEETTAKFPVGRSPEEPSR